MWETGQRRFTLSGASASPLPAAEFLFFRFKTALVLFQKVSQITFIYHESI